MALSNVELWHFVLFGPLLGCLFAVIFYAVMLAMPDSRPPEYIQRMVEDRAAKEPPVLRTPKSGPPFGRKPEAPPEAKIPELLLSDPGAYEAPQSVNKEVYAQYKTYRNAVIASGSTEPKGLSEWLTIAHPLLAKNVFE